MTSSPRDSASMQWFLLRGLVREAAHWGEFPDQMRARFPNSRITCLDFPGCGEHVHMRSPTSIGELAEFMHHQFREQADLAKKPRFLFAISLGGMVATEWLRRYPEDMQGVVFGNTSFGGLSPIYHRLSPSSLRHLTRILAERDPLKRERHVLAMISNRKDRHERVAAEWALVQKQRPVRLETFAAQLLAAARFQAPARRPQPEVLLLNSLGDQMVHPSCSEAIQKKWSCELRRHPSAGHDLTIDAPDWVLDEISSWLGQLESSVFMQSDPERVAADI